MADKKSSFSVTCSLLSQFLKEKRSSGELGLFDINIAAASAAPKSNEGGGGGGTISGMYQQQPTTLNLLPGLEVTAVSSQDANKPLTIFYGGKVNVFENLSADKAADLMNLACKGSAVVTTPSALPSNFADMHVPIARKASLHRFLQKRKDRIVAEAPYQVSASCKKKPRAEAEDAGSWLALGLQGSR